MATKEEKKDRAALIILPIVGGIAALWYFLTRKVSADPDKAILFGTVVDSSNGLPIKGVNVACDGYTGQTNAAGDYEIINIPPGEYGVTFSAEGYATAVL